MKTSDRLHVWSALLHVHAAVTRAIEAELRDARDLALSAYEVLDRLSEVEAPGARMQDLCDVAFLSPSGLTRLVDRLEEAGLVERTSCPADRRGTFAVLTPAGRRALEELRPRVVEAIDRHFARHLAAAEADVLLEVFRKVLVAHRREVGLRRCGC